MCEAYELCLHAGIQAEEWEGGGVLRLHTILD